MSTRYVFALLINEAPLLLAKVRFCSAKMLSILYVYFLSKVRIHHRQSNLDVVTAQRIPFSSPIFLINTYHNILMVYCSDCSVSFYRLDSVEAAQHGIYIVLLTSRKWYSL